MATTYVTDTADEYRLDGVTEPELDDQQAVIYFIANGVETAERQAQRLLAAGDGPADRYGQLYVHDGDGTAYCDTVHGPA